jgi:hypothetical protein
VPAGYMLYGGDVEYRHGWTCGPEHAAQECARCERLSVSVTAVLIIDNLVSGPPSYGTPIDSLWWTSPLEYLADTRVSSGPILDLKLRSVDADLLKVSQQASVGCSACCQGNLRGSVEGPKCTVLDGVSGKLRLALRPSFATFPKSGGTSVSRTGLLCYAGCEGRHRSMYST